VGQYEPSRETEKKTWQSRWKLNMVLHNYYEHNCQIIKLHDNMYWARCGHLRTISLYRVIRKDGLNWTVNGASTHARQLVAVFQVLCSLYGFTCVGYAQNSLEFVSRSPLIHSVGRSFYLYTDSLFAQIGDSNDKRSSSLEVECWNEDETHAAQQSATQF